jgi:hypothetical protein
MPFSSARTAQVEAIDRDDRNRLFNGDDRHLFPFCTLNVAGHADMTVMRFLRKQPARDRPNHDGQITACRHLLLFASITGG